jgi:hypothetical protein
MSSYIEQTPAGVIDWKLEALRTARLLADAERIIAEYKAQTIEAARQSDTAAFQNTDDADAVSVLAAVRHCANSWDGNARLVGNVRARDISRACTASINALAQTPPRKD